LCADDPTCPEAAAARHGLANVSELRGQFARTEELLTPLLETGDSGHLALEAHELVACSTFHQGAFERSLSNASAVLDSWDEDAYSVLMARIAEHPASSCSSWSSLANWALGRSDESLHQAERAVALGERNLYALSTAVQQRAMLHQLRNEPEECIEWADRCRRVGEDQDFPMRTIQADIYKGWALGVLGAPDEGMELLREGLSRFHDAGATLNEAYYLGLHADACLHGGEPERALELLDEALERMRATARTYFFHAELHRLRARGLLALGGSDAVEAARGALGESQAIAELQGAPTLLVRTLCDRIELELGAADGDAAPWRQALAAAVNRLDEDRPTPDAVRARSLLSGPDDA
jgi:predicted ATPase